MPPCSVYSTREYVSTAYSQLFPYTPISDLMNRTLTLSELRPTGREIAAALTKKHGSPTSTRTISLSVIEGPINASVPFALALYCRKIWGLPKEEGQLYMSGYLNGDGTVNSEGVYEVEGYRKRGLEELVVGGECGEYRVMEAAEENLLRVLEGRHPLVPEE